MSDSAFQTTKLRDLLARLQAGDPAARNELVLAAQGRLEALARRMLRKFPSVGRWAETDDVFQGALIRLLRALETVDVADTRAFLNLAAAVIRRELIDLARHFHGPHGLGANHASVAPCESSAPHFDPQAPPDESGELERWATLHAAVDALPVEQREVFGLRFYHRWEEVRIAELFGVDERTVRRRWRAACAALADALGGELPDAGETE
jgi:RNA polymerase sigma-70 factor (ECF subfamily)